MIDEYLAIIIIGAILIVYICIHNVYIALWLTPRNNNSEYVSI